MRLTQLSRAAGKRQHIGKFGGYWPDQTAAENQFYDMQNLCSDAYPYLKSRGARRQYAAGQEPYGIHGGERLLYLDGATLYYNKATAGQLEKGDKQFIQIGAQVLILPDKLLFDTLSQKLAPVEASFTTTGLADITLCADDGSALGEVSVGGTAPEEPADGALWLDTASTPNRLCQYSAASLCWIVRSDTAIQIAAPGIGALFSSGDGVTLLGCEEEALNGAHILLEATQDSVRFTGLLAQSFSQQAPLTLSRQMPDLDYAVELNNRIWGCNSKTREIYACKLADPRNWNYFAGTAADSYALSIGSLGEFTGAAAYQGAVLFFKEQCVHKILGTKPANFQLTTVYTAGVKKGAEKTLALAEGYLFYQAEDGIRLYGSSGSTLLSGQWAAGRQAGCAGAVGTKYYLYLPVEGILCYDLKNGLWHREDDKEVHAFAACMGTLYAQFKDGGIWRVSGRQIEGQQEEEVAWQAVTGEIAVSLPTGSYISDLSLRVLLNEGSTLAVDACYDESGEYIEIYRLNGGPKRTYRLPILPRFTQTMRLRLRGKGEMCVYSLTKRVRTI